MKKLFLIMAMALFAFGASAQMNFTKSSFDQALVAAGKADKLVFVDVFTTWCPPCKHLSENIFPDKTVGTLMNDKFINIAIDAEKGEGKDIALKYAVKAYPTMLILNKKGEELTRVVGSSKTPADFVERITKALDEIKDNK